MIYRIANKIHELPWIFTLDSLKEHYTGISLDFLDHQWPSFYESVCDVSIYSGSLDLKGPESGVRTVTSEQFHYDYGLRYTWAIDSKVNGHCSK